jgi:hypothetical protein
MLASGTRAQAPDEGSVTEQGQAPPKEEKSKPKEFRRVFCAERSAAQVNMLVGTINCNELCENVYQEYPCELQRLLSDGWKVTSVSTGSIVANIDPCECRVTGTESVLEKD